MSAGLLPTCLRRVRLHDKSILRPRSNQERIAAFRAHHCAELGNAYPWPHRNAEQYAIEQMRDHPTNFAGSYGDLAHGY